MFDLIYRQIAETGPLTVEDYMQIVLHHPEHGYYRQGVPVGREGDFSTGPEQSQMFGEMVGAWCIQSWEALGKPDPFVLLELGPGRGTLMKSLLSGTSAREDFHKAMRLFLLESNVTFRQMQRERLTLYGPTHLETLDDLPALPLLVVGNEFFDTFPMRQFIRRRRGWRERMVKTKSGRLVLCEGPVCAPPPILGPEHEVKTGWIYETSPRSHAVIKCLGQHMVEHGGAGVLIDYGYENPTGEDTLFAFRRHKHTDILSRPGETDVTGDVDFAAFRSVAKKAGAHVWGPIGQGDFFQSLGIHLRALQLRRNSPTYADKIDEELYRLTHPAVMGVWFKVLGLAGQDLTTLPGFRDVGACAAVDQ